MFSIVLAWYIQGAAEVFDRGERGRERGEGRKRKLLETTFLSF